MKRLFVLLVASVLTSYVFAQRRYPVENMDTKEIDQTSSTKRHRIGSQTTAPLKSIGVKMIPVILVQFPDLKFVSDTLNMTGIEHSDENVRMFYDKYCNGTGVLGENFTYPNGSHGAVADYFLEQSDSIFQPYFQVIGPVTLSKSYSYYGKDNSDTSKDVNVSQFYKEALTLAIGRYSAWDEFDNNGDGKSDFVFFLYAGEGQNAYGSISECKSDGNPEKSNLLWPKESAYEFTVESHKFGGYGMTNELYGKRTDGVGTMCHELSHGLGLPDLYYTGNTNGEDCFGMDYWDVMDAGNYCRTGRCPSAYNTYERDFMGWRKLVELNSMTAPQTITLEPIQRGGVGYKLVNPANKNEYYILENRQRIGFDSYLGLVTTSHNGLKIVDTYGYNHGMMVIHIDYLQSSWTTNSVNKKSHPRYTILPADGQLHSSIGTLEGYTNKYFESMASDLYPGYKHVTSIPSERFTLYTGGTLPIDITKITEKDDGTIVLDLNGGEPYVEPDVIEGIIAEDGTNAQSSAYYDLSGRKVLNPQRGIYIRGGKKVFVK